MRVEELELGLCNYDSYFTVLILSPSSDLPHTPTYKLNCGFGGWVSQEGLGPSHEGATGAPLGLLCARAGSAYTHPCLQQQIQTMRTPLFLLLPGRCY